jgi:hypothetical protein
MLLIFGAALLYASVGHGGASGYLAAMALFGQAPAVMKPTARVLNLVVAMVGTIRFARAGYFDRELGAVCAVGWPVDGRSVGPAVAREWTGCFNPARAR